MELETSNNAIINDSTTIAAPPSDVWNIMSDLSGIAKWAPGVTAAHFETDQTVGDGALRWCDLENPDGSTGYVRELFSDWRDGTGFTYEVIESSFPVERIVNKLALVEQADNTTAVSMEMNLTPAPGMDKAQQQGLTAALTEAVAQAVEALKTFAETGASD